MSMSNALLGVLWDAVVSGDAARIRDVLEFSGDAPKTPAVGALLWHAVGRGDLEVAAALVRAGADLSVRDPGNPHENLSLLHFAAARSRAPEYERLALLLLEHGADVEARDVHDWSVLFCAVQAESPPLVAELLRRGATVFECEEPATSSVLELAVDASASEQMLQLLVWECEDAATRSERAFFVAEQYMDSGDVELVRGVLERGLPVDYANRGGWTLLHCAVGAGNVEMVKLLLQCGANVNEQVAQGATPLHLACFWPESTIPILLLEGGADVHAASEDGRRPIHVACHNQAASSVHLLLQLGADVTAADAKGRTPLSLMGCAETLTLAETLVVRHLALLASLGKTVTKTDLAFVESNDATRTVFQACLDELQSMNQVKIVDHVSYFSVVSKGPARVSALTRNSDFLASFEKNCHQMTEWFPAYSPQLTSTVHVARRNQDFLRFAKSRLTEILGDALPHLVMDKINSHLCSDALQSIQRNYYLRLHAEINGRIDSVGRTWEY